MQSLLRVLYPLQCVTCDAFVEEGAALCGSCWKGANFISGLVCDCCGTPLPGEDEGPVLCDDCMSIARPWSRGRAVFLYSDIARRIVLSLKHADRTDLALPAARWIAQAAKPLIHEDILIVPVPLHWRRRVKRRFNQSAEIARALSDLTGKDFAPEALSRTKRTKSLNGLTRAERFDVLSEAICVPASQRDTVAGRDVLLIDDVMTSGATLAACAEALNQAGAASINVAVLARVAKEP